MNILLIEPDKKLADIYKTCLAQTGHNVAWAGHAQDAVIAADEKTPDLVVLELQLAAHNGIEFLYEFRSYAEWQNVPVVLLTYVTPQSLSLTPSSMQNLGIVRMLYKPATTLQQLKRAVSEHLLLQSVA